MVTNETGQKMGGEGWGGNREGGGTDVVERGELTPGVGEGC